VKCCLPTCPITIAPKWPKRSDRSITDRENHRWQRKEAVAGAAMVVDGLLHSRISWRCS
jgi:hypothetical protein